MALPNAGAPGAPTTYKFLVLRTGHGIVQLRTTVQGQPVKPSRDLKPGDVLEVVRGDLRLRLKALAFPPQRLGASRVPEFCENQTPEEWIQRASELRRQREMETPHAHETVTKPNKQQMRQLREWWEQGQEVRQ